MKTAKQKYLWLNLIATLLVYTGCKKDKPVSNAPSITYVSIAPNPAVKYQDTVKIVISYTDADGDLGVDSPDAKNLFVTDSRNNVTSQFRIQQLAPTNANINIEGNLDVILSPQGFTNDGDSTETATYSIYVVDRAGNKSNTVQTDALLIKHN